MNEGNLIPASKRQARERRELGSKGGKTSAKKKREKKAFSETIKELLSMEAKDRSDLEKLKNYGEDMSNQMLLAVSMFETAIDKSPQSVSAFNALLIASGEKVEKLEVSTIDKSVKEIQEYIKSSG